MIDYKFLEQGHTLKKSPDGSIIFYYPSCTNEIPLPNPGYHLYSCWKLTIQPQREGMSGMSADRHMQQSPSRATTSTAKTTPPVHHEAVCLCCDMTVMMVESLSFVVDLWAYLGEWEHYVIRS